GEALAGGRAAETFGRMVSALGGPSGFIEDCRAFLPRAATERAVAAERGGFVTAIATRGIGLAVVGLGGGRSKPDDLVDHSVGITGLLPVGTEIRPGDPLAIVRARSPGDAEAAAKAIREAYDIGSVKPARQKLVMRRIGAPAF